MIDLFLKGGVLMWPILFCSALAVAVIIERFYRFHKYKIDVDNFIGKIKSYLEKNKLKEAESFSKKFRGAIPKITCAAISICQLNIDCGEKEKRVFAEGSNALRKMEKHLRTLGIIAHITPLMGLLGTVTGMMKAFMKIQELSGAVDASVLAGGIWEAMITTAAGLVVAIPTMVAYHYFEGRIDDISSQMKCAARMVLDCFGQSNCQMYSDRKKIKEDIEYGL